MFKEPIRWSNQAHADFLTSGKGDSLMNDINHLDINNEDVPDEAAGVCRRKRFNFSALRSRQYPSWLLPVLVSMLLGIIYYLSGTIYIAVTNEYLFADYSIGQIFTFSFSTGFLPVYLFVVKLSSLIFGEGYLYVISIFQLAVFFVSVAVFSMTCSYVTKNRWLSTLFPILYGVCPIALRWCTYISADSLTISFLVFFLYFLVKYIYFSGWKPAVGCTTTLLVLVFLTPGYIYLAVAFFVFCLICYIAKKSERALLKKTILLTALVIILALVFCGFNMVDGSFSMSNSSVYQRVSICINNGLYQYCGDPEFIADADAVAALSGGESWTAMVDLIEKWGFQYSNKMCFLSAVNNPGAYFSYVASQVSLLLSSTYSSAFNSSAIVSAVSSPGAIQSTFHSVYDSAFGFLNLGHFLMLIVLELILSIVATIRFRRHALCHVTVFLFMLGIFVYTFINTSVEQIRFTSHAIPLICFSAMICLDLIQRGAYKSVYRQSDALFDKNRIAEDAYATANKKLRLSLVSSCAEASAATRESINQVLEAITEEDMNARDEINSKRNAVRAEKKTTELAEKMLIEEAKEEAKEEKIAKSRKEVRKEKKSERTSAGKSEKMRLEDELAAIREKAETRTKQLYDKQDDSDESSTKSE